MKLTDWILCLLGVIGIASYIAMLVIPPVRHTREADAQEDERRDKSHEEAFKNR